MIGCVPFGLEPSTSKLRESPERYRYASLLGRGQSRSTGIQERLRDTTKASTWVCGNAAETRTRYLPSTSVRFARMVELSVSLVYLRCVRSGVQLHAADDEECRQ
jgi:hypothetical protein